MNNTLVAVPAQRTANVTEILTTLKRYDVSVIKDLEDYLRVQCEQNFSDVNANLALLKLYELSSEALTEEREESTINILLLGLASFYNADFELYLHLLPVYVLSDLSKIKNISPEDSSVFQFSEAVSKLKELYVLLTSAKFTQFWNLLRNEDYYQDLVFDSYLGDSFQNSIRNLVSNLIYKGYTNGNPQIKARISSGLLQDYLNLYDDEFEKFVNSKNNFKTSGDFVLLNHDAHLIAADSKDAEQISLSSTHNPIISSENIKFDQLSRLLKENLEK